MSLAGRVIMTVTATLCAFLGPMAGNVIPNSGYVPLEGRVSNIYRESTPKQITYYPYKALQVDKNASPGNSYPQYSYMMVRPSLQRNTFKTNDLRKPHKKENYIGTDDGISHQWKLLPRSNSISTIKSGNFGKDHVVQHTSMKVYPSKRVSDVEQEEYLDKTGVLGKNIDQASSQHEKLAYLSPKVSQLQKDEFYIQHKSKESSKPHAMSHHHPILKQNAKSSVNDVYFVAIVAGCTAAAIFGAIASGICFYRFKKKSKAASDVEYPAYGVIGPGNKEKSSPNGDNKLAHSAQMYHYQHQKQQIIALEKVNSCRLASSSDVESEEEENNEADYTVYECPGLALTGEMEVQNPLFIDESEQALPQLPKENGK